MTDNRKPIFAPPRPNMDDPDTPLNAMAKEFKITKEQLLEQNPELTKLYKRVKDNPEDKMTGVKYSLEVMKVWRKGQVARLNPVNKVMYDLGIETKLSRDELLGMYPKLGDAYDKAKTDATQLDKLFKVANSVVKQEKIRKLKELLKPREFKFDPKMFDKFRISVEKAPKQKEQTAEKSVSNVNKLAPGQLLHDVFVQPSKGMKGMGASMQIGVSSKLQSLMDKSKSSDILIEKK